MIGYRVRSEVLLDGIVSLVQYRNDEYHLAPRISLRFDRIEVRLNGPLTVAGVRVMQLLIIGGGAVITSDVGVRLVDLAREMGAAVVATFPNDVAFLPRTVVFDVITEISVYPHIRLSAGHLLGQLPASSGCPSHRQLNRARPPRADIMTTDDTDHFQQQIVDIQADWRYDFDLQRAPDFPVDSRFAVGRAACG